MKWFLKTCEVIRAHGVQCSLDGKRREINPKVFDEYLEKVTPIVFMPKNMTPEMLSEENPDHQISEAPFQFFSVEMYGDNTPISVPNWTQEEGTRANLYCIVCYESSPHVWGYLALCKGYYEDTHNEFWMVLRVGAVGTILQALIDRLNTGRMGAETVRQTVKIGSGKDKRIHRIRQVIYCGPKKNYEKINETVQRNIDWSHRWQVRGHWVKLEGRLGKNRDGEYVVSGWTWRSQYEKGPEGKPLIKKVRVVEY